MIWPCREIGPTQLAEPGAHEQTWYSRHCGSSSICDPIWTGTAVENRTGSKSVLRRDAVDDFPQQTTSTQNFINANESNDPPVKEVLPCPALTIWYRAQSTEQETDVLPIRCCHCRCSRSVFIADDRFLHHEVLRCT